MPVSQEQARKQSKQMGLVFAVVLVVAIVVFAGGAYLFTRAFTGHIATVADFETMTLTASNYSDKVATQGSIKAATSVAVTPEVDGVVESVSVKEGDVVSEGDVLLTLKNDSLTEAEKTASEEYTAAQSSEKSAQTKLKKAQSSLTSASKSLTKAEKNLASAEKKNAAAQAAAESAQADDAESEGDSSGSTASLVDLEPYEEAVSLASASVENAQQLVDSANDALDAAQQDLKSKKSAYKKASAQVDKLSVKASSAGTVTSLSVKKGQGIVASALTEGVMEIVDTSTLICVVQVPESQLSNVSKGLSAVVRCEALGDEEISATVSRISDVPSEGAGDTSQGDSAIGDPNQANVTYYDVTLALGKVGDNLKVGMSASADINVRDFGTVYYIPATAVASNNAGMYVVAVLDSATTKQYSVTQLGTTDDGELIVQGTSLSEGMNIRTDLSAGV